MKFYLKTLGCKMNHLDSALLAAKLESVGHQQASEDEAEYVFVNSCTVTHGADRDSKKEALKAQKSKKKTVFLGCGPKVDKEKWQKLLPDALVFAHEEELLTYFKAGDAYDLPPVIEGTRFPIVIQNGCDNACTFCITHKARGRHISKSAEKIITEIKHAESLGFKEIFLTGINIAAWGSTNSNHSEEACLGKLLLEILAKTEIPRIRLSSLGPQYLHEDFWQAYQNKRICDYLHLSVQSGSDSVLLRMNRKNTAQDIKDIAAKARSIRPDTAICADIIVGFPGETEKEHQETFKTLQETQFAKLHVFPYSKRTGTPGDKMPNQVDERLKRSRAKELRNLAEVMRTEFIASQLGKTITVLTEKNQTGLTSNYIKVKTEKEPFNKILELELNSDLIIF